ncbi:MAG: SDR family oxidoreductase [Chlorobium sp.]|uniref:SDR family NAD(P)-dependent oxidoreductase n=1 Tax=Chlorobium sp. TaxID=1095 RepID=UPI0025BFF817|nr:SDR family NAD(P)-dependent oxidoreductase [Chlorobium sp.]MCF8383146.1 SDR family oxidoreductase [Chlorobium sp.]
MWKFENRVVLVSGAAGNLGKAVASAFYEAGADLALSDLHTESISSAFADSSRVMVLECDLTQPDSAETMVRTVLDRFGRIDAVTALTGGFSMGGPLHETSVDEWEFMMKLNAATLFNIAHAVLPHMRQRRGGRIVTVGARAAISGRARMASYTASKAAVMRMTESMSEENKLFGINVNCVLPSIIDTPLNRRDMPDADFTTWVSPAALADVILFLASDASRAIHGASIPVYGLC